MTAAPENVPTRGPLAVGRGEPAPGIGGTRAASPMPSAPLRRGPPPAPRPPPAARALRRIAVTALLLSLLGVAVWWVLRVRSLDWQIQRGLALLSPTCSVAEVRNALDAWERETAAHWSGRSEQLIKRLIERGDLTDRRVRQLLTRVSGADYGDRKKAWQQWFENRRRIRAGEKLKIAREDLVRLDLRWTARIGLTMWFSTLVPIDGQIYVASLGTDFDDPRDTADALVRVDGTTGESVVLFAAPPEHRGPRDMIGVAAGDGCLLAACYNGYVYCVAPSGQLLWSAHAGSPIVGAPLSYDVNGDGTSDAVVVTRAGKVVALSGKRGTTLWVTALAQSRSDDRDLLGATLAVGDLLSDAGRELVVTTRTGALEVLAVRTGKSLWRHTLAAGTLSGAVARGPDQAGPPAYVADWAGCVWSLVRSGRALEAVPVAAPALRWDETLLAGVRTLSGAPGTLPLLVVCPTGDYAAGRGGVCALRADGVEWRLPLGGAVWGTPAVADLNGNGRVVIPEVIATSFEPAADGGVDGVLTIVSSDGQCLRRVRVPAPLECSPLVADVDGDRLLEVLVADQGGVLYCFRTEGFGPVEWGQFGGDSHNTRNAANAYEYGQLPVGLQAAWKPK